MIADVIKILHWAGASIIAMLIICGVIFFINAVAAFIVDLVEKRKSK